MNEENGLELKGVMSEGYGIIPKKVMNDTGLSVEAKSIYAFIASYSGNGNTAFPTVDYITHKLNISRQRFNKHRKQLEDKGYITVKQERQEGSQFNHNIYTIEYIPMPWLSFPTSENPTSQNPTSQNVTTNNNSINNNSINNNSINNTSTHSENASEIKKQKDKEIEEQFKEWYDIYDKKRDRAKALKSFKTKYKKHGYEKILEGTKAYLKTVTDKQYQKYPATFLNAESYLDIEEFNNTSKNRPDNNAIEEINVDEI